MLSSGGLQEEEEEEEEEEVSSKLRQKAVRMLYTHLEKL
jgi:hypothetical protein